VQFAGTASRAEVAGLLARADVYVQLSRHEGLSLSTCEALVSGTPAVLSVASCPSREVADFEHVEVVEPTMDQAVAAILAVLRELDSYTAAARRCLPAIRELFSWERIARTHLDQYLDIAGSSPRP
jgi:glycosyltransferase involved in cell wall biosynthesis